MARTEQACKEAFRKLCELVDSQSNAEGLSLPSERDMAKDFNVSRMTLRKAISRAIEQGIIIKAARGYISASSTTSCENANIIFFSSGRGVPSNRVWGRVLSHLAKKGAESSITVHPWMIYDQKISPALLQDKLKELKNPFVVFSTNQSSELMDLTMQEGIPCFMLDKQFHRSGMNLICLDNYQTGQKSAEYLIKQNCRNILILHDQLFNSYSPFQQRDKGFRERCQKESGINLTTKTLNTKFYYAGKSNFDELVENISPAEYEGIYVYTDEGLLMFVEALSQKCDLPEIITLFGNGNLNDRTLPVAYLDHAEEKIADQILHAIKNISRSGIDPKSEIYLTPELNTNTELIHKKHENVLV